MRLSTTADVESTDLSLGPDPAKVGTSMDELIRAVNGSAARATIRKGADDAVSALGLEWLP